MTTTSIRYTPEVLAMAPQVMAALTTCGVQTTSSLLEFWNHLSGPQNYGFSTPYVASGKGRS